MPLRSLGLLALVALLLAACGGNGERVSYIALTGEAPGARPAYIDLLDEHPLGLAPPDLGGAVFRPPPVPEGEASETPDGRQVAALKRTYEQLRLRLSDRDDALQFRRRSIRVALGAYVSATERLRLQHGDPLPPYDEALRGRIADARQALAEVRADLLQFGNVHQGGEADIRAADAVLARGRAVQAGATAGSPDGELADALVAALERARQTASALVAATAEDMARLVVYVDGQEQSLDNFERQARAAGTGGDEGYTPPAILRRRSILDP